MNSVNKEQLLNVLESRVEQHIQEAVSVFQNLNAQELLKAAPDGGWSIAQCLWHLNSYSEYYLPEIKKALGNYRTNSIGTDFKSGWLGNYFTNMMEPKPGFMKMKAFKNHVPPIDLDAHAVVAAFIQHQEELLPLLQTARQADLNKIRIPISISKWIQLKLGDVFQFLIAHDARHLAQAKKHLSVAV